MKKQSKTEYQYKNWKYKDKCASGIIVQVNSINRSRKQSLDDSSAYYKGQTFVQSGLLPLHVNQAKITEHNSNINL